MARKLTPQLTREIKKLARAGDSTREIAAKVGLSRGSVSNVLATARTNGKNGTPSKPAAAPPPEPEPMDGTPPTLDEQLSWLGQTVRARRLDAQRLRAAGDDLGAARATRDLLSAQALLARHTPTGEQTGVFLSNETIGQSASRAREKLLERVRRRALKAADGPKCPTCGHARAAENP